MRPITISLSPNTEPDDVSLALKTLCSPSQWKTGEAQKQVVEWFTSYFNNPNILLYNSGRSAEYEILKAFGIGKGDEVIVQAFTCVAVPNSVIWNDATPVYCDIDESLNLSVEHLKKCITKKTKAIIVQHTFGIPAEIDKIVELAREHNLIVIEDCAHSLGATYKGKLLGTWGDGAFFSFGRDKVVSSVFGGAGFIHKRNTDIFSQLTHQYESLSYPSSNWIAQQLFHPVAFSIILPLYTAGIGKVLLYLFQKLRLLSYPVYPEEKQGKQPDIFPEKFPNALAILAFQQLNKLERYNANRRKITELYKRTLLKNKSIECTEDREGAIYLRFSICLKNPDILIRVFKEQGILIGNWYRSAVDPKGTNELNVGYIKGSCPRAEDIASRIVNLPTRISLESAQKILSVIQSEV